MNIWFTADYHLGHANIIKYCDRPFKDIDEMNKTIIRNHNERVKPDDIVFHNGDFCFKGGKEGGRLPATEWEKQLNGKIIHIKGNHDSNNSTKTPIMGMTLSIGGKVIYMLHNEKHINPTFPYSLYFTAHVHQLWKFKRKKQDYKIIDLINIGVDVWDFRPHTINEIKKEYYRWRNKIDEVSEH